MSRAARFYNPQFDLFLPSIVDLKFRDQKDTMERPFFSLSKAKRMKPIGDVFGRGTVRIRN